MGKPKVTENMMKQFSRREFLSTLSKTTAGLFITPYLRSGNIYAYDYKNPSQYLARVAITEADNYERTLIKQKVQHLFESLGGIEDLAVSGNKVAIKINLTGRSINAQHSRLGGVDIREAMWTHPEVLRAAGELLIDAGINANDIYIVEALWDDESYNDFGYAEVQQNLGVQMVNLNNSAPYDDFIDKPVGDNSFFYSTLRINRILDEVDVYISIPKMKQHFEAGVTYSIKNQIGMVPIQFYTLPSITGYRAALHFEGGDIATHLPRSICDLNFVRPVHFALIDGIKNAVGGEGAWNPTFQPAEYGLLIAGKDPVAADSVAAYLMGNDPESDKFQLPDGVRQCDNYLYLLHQMGMGTNQMKEIEIVGDGAGRVDSIPSSKEAVVPEDFQLYQNFPNPFNPSTTIRFYLPYPSHVTLRVLNVLGQTVETLVDGNVPAGYHEIQWRANNMASGVYFYKMEAGSFTATKKLIYRK